MPTPKPKQFQSWSYSTYSTYTECPLRAKLRHLDKVPEGEGESPALVHGSKVHKLAENYVAGGGELPHELKRFEVEFAELVDLKAKPEDKWAITPRWVRTSWFGTDVWARAMVDCHHPTDDGLRIIDYKTGKIRGSYHRQLGWYALLGFLFYPNVDTIETELWFLDHGEILGGKRSTIEDEESGDGLYHRELLSEMQQSWLERVTPMMADTEFAPNPGAACRWCPYKALCPCPA